jgi:tRNA threonylcarbamoyladenosine biosynthesis protein TsaB
MKEQKTSRCFVFGVDLSGSSGSAALLDTRSGKTILRRFEIHNDHSRLLLRGMEELLSEASAGWKDVAAYGVTSGPGSFTGLRVALATIQGLVFENPAPVYPVGTLETSAWQAGRHMLGSPFIAALLDAGRGEIYAALFRRSAGGELDCREEPRLLTPERWLERAYTSHESRLVLCGNAVERCVQVSSSQKGLRPQWECVPSAPLAEACAEIALRRLQRGGLPPSQPELRYVRPPDVR